MTAKKPKPKQQILLKRVENCNGCPFADDGDSTEAAPGKWTCHAKYTREGWGTPIPVPSKRSPIPKKCPLRTSPILVVLTPTMVKP